MILRIRNEVDENGFPVEPNGVPSSSRDQRSVFTRPISETEHDEQLFQLFYATRDEVDAFFAKNPTVRDHELKSTDDLRDLGVVGVLREMYVKHNTRVPAGAVSRFVISVCNRVMWNADVQPGPSHSARVFLKVNWDLVSHLKMMRDS